MFSIVLVTLWCDLGYNLVILMSGLDNIPNMFLEAAEIDGANSIQKFFKITLPLMSRNMLFVVIMTCISYFQVFAQVQIMTQGGPENHTNVIGLNIYNYAFQIFADGIWHRRWQLCCLVFILIVTLVQLKVGKQGLGILGGVEGEKACANRENYYFSSCLYSCCFPFF